MFTEVTAEGEKQEEKGVKSVSTSAQSRRRTESDHGPDNVALHTFLVMVGTASPSIP